MIKVIKIIRGHGTYFKDMLLCTHYMWLINHCAVGLTFQLAGNWSSNLDACV